MQWGRGGLGEDRRIGKGPLSPVQALQFMGVVFFAVPHSGVQWWLGPVTESDGGYISFLFYTTPR